MSRAARRGRPACGAATTRVNVIQTFPRGHRSHGRPRAARRVQLVLARAAAGVGLGLDPATAMALAAVVHVVALVPIALAGAAALVSETLSGRSVRFFGAAADQRDG